VPCGINDLIADCEAVRTQLGIGRWSLIGHSFGGYLAVLYASAHPSAVQSLVLENPVMDLGSSARSLLAAAALEFGRAGDADNACACLALAYGASEAPPAVLWAELTAWLLRLGSARNELYIHGDNKQIVEDLMQVAPFPPEWWQRGGTHQSRLVEEGGLYRPLQGMLRSIPHRMLLIKGRYDSVFAPEQIALCLQEKPAVQWRVFSTSGHFVHIEEPVRFADEVLSFLRGAATSGS